MLERYGKEVVKKIAVNIQRLAIFVLGLFYVLLAIQPANAATTITDLRLGSDGQRSRIVIEADGPLKTSFHTMIRPWQIIIELSEADWRLQRQRSNSDALVSGIQHQALSYGGSRITVDLSGPAHVAQTFRLPPKENTGFRYVFDILPADYIDSQLDQKAAQRPERAFAALNLAEAPIPQIKPDNVPLSVADSGTYTGTGTGTGTGTEEANSSTTEPRQLALATPPNIKQPKDANQPQQAILTPPPAAAAEPQAESRRSAPESYPRPAERPQGLAFYRLPQRAPEAQPAPMNKPRKFVIALDAGHGGNDPGAISISGYREKDLTLHYARALRDFLTETGRYKVILTRNDDRYLRLGERVRLIRDGGADLFISIHADSLADREFRGAGVYTLSETASDEEAAALAQKENKSDAIAGVDLTEHEDDIIPILIDLAQRETKNYSAEFAGLLVPELKRFAQLRTRPHRFAGFRVLTAPDVPSVLLELGYLSNIDDERYLHSPAGQEAVVRAVAAAIDRYFDRIK